MASSMPVVFKVAEWIVTSHVKECSVKTSRAMNPDFALQQTVTSKQGTCSAALKMRRAEHRARRHQSVSKHQASAALSGISSRCEGQHAALHCPCHSRKAQGATERGNFR